jgi:hypothetical protein
MLLDSFEVSSASSIPDPLFSVEILYNYEFIDLPIGSLSLILLPEFLDGNTIHTVSHFVTFRKYNTVSHGNTIQYLI